MKFKNRKVIKEDGEIELKLSLSFSPEELAGIESIMDDMNASPDNLRIEGNQAQRVDHYLCFVRVLAHYADIWENKPEQVMHLCRGRKLLSEHRRNSPRKRKKRK